MPSIFLRIVAAAAVTCFAAAPDAYAFRQSATFTPLVSGSGENQSVVAPTDVMGTVQPRAIIAGTGENLSVQHLDVPPPTPPGYVAVIAGSGENISVVHIPTGN